MRTDNMAWDFDDVVDELRFLRKNEGFTPRRYYDLMVIPSLLGRRGQGFYLSRMHFVDAIHALHDSQLRGALLAAFGLMEGYEDYFTVQMRRERYGIEVKRGYDTLRHWEDVGLEQLAAVLIKCRECGGVRYMGAVLSRE